MFQKLKDFDFKGKRVLVRVDFNLPLKDGKVTDNKRVIETLPTIKFILDKNPKQLIVMSHLGRPKGKIIEELRTDPLAKELQKVLGEPVKKLDGCADIEIPDDKIIFLENVQFYPGERDNDDEYARKLASYADIFVMDAYGQAHRNYATLTKIQKFIPSCAGLLVEKEYDMLDSIIKNPEKPFNAIIGGAKADKISVIKNLLTKVDNLIIGGVLANTFLKAKGVDIKGSKYDEETLAQAEEILETSGDKIVLPVDAVAADSFDENADSKTVELSEIPDDWLILDIGPKTVEKYKEVLKDSKVVVWAGPVGVFEFDKFSSGTKEIAEFIASLDCKSLIGGGESAAAVQKLGLQNKMTHVSTGGGASLTLLEGKELAAVKALEENFKTLS